MLVNYLALVSETPAVPVADVMRITAALQKQATRDFEPLWGVRTVIDAFMRLEDVPLGYWPMIVRDDIGFPGAAGIHLDQDGQPFALIQASDSWSLTASHECLEMLGDPFGNRLIAGPSIHPDQGRVEYLVEVCDPSEHEEFGYTVNDLLVSDFYTERYFDPVQSAGVQYSFSGAISVPREVLPGGYISWHDPASDHWFQQVFFGNQLEFRDLGVLGQLNGGLREAIDARTTVPSLMLGLDAGNARLLMAVARAGAAAPAVNAKASSWHAQIEALKAAAAPPPN